MLGLQLQAIKAHLLYSPQRH